jgi:hypothetical protein
MAHPRRVLPTAIGYAEWLGARFVSFVEDPLDRRHHGARSHLAWDTCWPISSDAQQPSTSDTAANRAPSEAAPPGQYREQPTNHL